MQLGLIGMSFLSSFFIPRNFFFFTRGMVNYIGPKLS